MRSVALHLLYSIFSRSLFLFFHFHSYFHRFDLNEPLSPHVVCNPGASLQLSIATGVHPSRSVSHDLSDQRKGLLEVPTFGFSTSPKTGSFEFESITKLEAGVLFKSSSADSVHSTSSQ